MYKLRHGTQMCLVPIANKLRIKNTYPDRPWPETIKNAENATGLIGMAFCDNPECLTCLNKDPIHWSYKT